MNDPDTPDQQQIDQWLELARQGDPDAFGQLFKLYHHRLYAVVSRVVSNPEDANDITQRAWVKAWQKLDTFKGTSTFYTWLCRVATFTALDHLRFRKRRGEVEFLDEINTVEDSGRLASHPSDTPDRAMQRAEVRERFEAALQELSDKHRTALVLREIEGLSYSEIAEIMDCQIGTVMSRIFNARRQIQHFLKDTL